MIVGQDCHITVWEEATFATKPETPVYLFLPVTSYGPKLTAKRRNSRPVMGQLAQKHGKNYQGYVEGAIAGSLHGWWPTSYTHSLAYHTLRHGLGLAADTGKNAPSFGAEFAQGPNVANKQHNGLMCNSFTLQGSADDGFIGYTMNTLGVDEASVETAQTVPSDMERLVDFEYPDCSITVDGSAVEIESFNLTRNFGLKQKFGGNRFPHSCYRTSKFAQIQLTFLKEDDAYDVAHRAVGTDFELPIVLTMDGLHNGTGAADTDYTRMVITATRCQLVLPDDAVSIDDAISQTLTFDVLKPDSATDDLSFAESCV